MKASFIYRFILFLLLQQSFISGNPLFVINNGIQLLLDPVKAKELIAIITYTLNVLIEEKFIKPNEIRNIEIISGDALKNTIKEFKINIPPDCIISEEELSDNDNTLQTLILSSINKVKNKTLKQSETTVIIALSDLVGSYIEYHHNPLKQNNSLIKIHSYYCDNFDHKNHNNKPVAITIPKTVSDIYLFYCNHNSNNSNNKRNINQTASNKKEKDQLEKEWKEIYDEEYKNQNMPLYEHFLVKYLKKRLYENKNITPDDERKFKLWTTIGRKNIPCIVPKLAMLLGGVFINMKIHGAKIYYSKIYEKFFSFDQDGHKGSFWKVFKNKDDLSNPRCFTIDLKIEIMRI